MKRIFHILIKLKSKALKQRKVTAALGLCIETYKVSPFGILINQYATVFNLRVKYNTKKQKKV